MGEVVHYAIRFQLERSQGNSIVPRLMAERVALRVFAALELEVGSFHQNVSVMSGIFLWVGAFMAIPSECALSNL